LGKANDKIMSRLPLESEEAGFSPSAPPSGAIASHLHQGAQRRGMLVATTHTPRESLQSDP